MSSEVVVSIRILLTEMTTLLAARKPDGSELGQRHIRHKSHFNAGICPFTSFVIQTVY